LISLYGLSGVKVDFKTTYFIKQDHFINDYLTKMDTYFEQGDTINIIFDNKDGSIDFSTRENQKKLADWNDRLKDCDGCREKWLLDDSFKSWYGAWLGHILGNYDDKYIDGKYNHCYRGYEFFPKVVKTDIFYRCL